MGPHFASHKKMTNLRTRESIECVRDGLQLALTEHFWHSDCSSRSRQLSLVRPSRTGIYASRGCRLPPPDPIGRRQRRGDASTATSVQSGQSGGRSNFQKSKKKEKRAGSPPGVSAAVAFRLAPDPTLASAPDHLIKTEEAALFGRRAMSRTGAAVRPQGAMQAETAM
jgi:hypothetical protein